jgi:hypothetical protein
MGPAHRSRFRSRAAVIVTLAALLTDFLGETKPDVWVADRYAAHGL